MRRFQGRVARWGWLSLGLALCGWASAAQPSPPGGTGADAAQAGPVATPRGIEIPPDLFREPPPAPGDEPLELLGGWTRFREAPGEFGPEGERLLDRLEAFFLREYNATPLPQPEAMIDGLAECLREHGLNDEGTARTLRVMISAGMFTFADRIRAEAHLDALFPRSDAGDRAGREDDGVRDEAGVPHGLCSIIHYGVEDPFQTDAVICRESLEEFGATVLEADGTVSPVVDIDLWEGALVSQPRDVTFRAEIEVTSLAHPERTLFTTNVSREMRVTDANRSRLDPLALPVRPADVDEGDALTVEVRYEVSERANPPAAQPAVFRGTFRLILGPRKGVGLHDGFVMALADQEGPVPIPGLVHPRFVGFVRSNILYGKSWLKQGQLSERKAAAIERALDGMELRRLEMVSTARRAGPAALDLPAAGRTVIVFGASWCGPCKALEPLVADYAAVLARAGSPDTLLKMSIEDDDALAEHLADPAFNASYPDGVVSEALKEKFAIKAVPAYFVVEDGTIREHGILDRAVLERWRAEAEAREGGSPP